MKPITIFSIWGALFCAASADAADATKEVGGVFRWWVVSDAPAGATLNNVTVTITTPNGATSTPLNINPNAPHYELLNQPFTMLTTIAGTYTVRGTATCVDAYGQVSPAVVQVRTVNAYNPYKVKTLTMKYVPGSSPSPNGGSWAQWLAAGPTATKTYNIYKYNIPGTMTAGADPTTNRYDGQSASRGGLPADFTSVVRQYPGSIALQKSWSDGFVETTNCDASGVAPVNFRY